MDNNGLSFFAILFLAFLALSAALIVDLPLQPLCDEDCQGLCPQCGKNLNDGPCGCEPPQDDVEFEEAKNPFAALKDFPFGEPQN